MSTPLTNHALLNLGRLHFKVGHMAQAETSHSDGAADALTISSAVAAKAHDEQGSTSSAARVVGPGAAAAACQATLAMEGIRAADDTRSHQADCGRQSHGSCTSDALSEV